MKIKYTIGSLLLLTLIISGCTNDKTNNNVDTTPEPTITATQSASPTTESIIEEDAPTATPEASAPTEEITNAPNPVDSNATEKPSTTTETPTTQKNNTTVKESTNTEIKFANLTFQIPSNYTEVQNSNEPVPIAIYDVNKDGSSLNIISQATPQGITLDKFVETALDKTTYTIESKKNVDINGIQWNEIIATSKKDNIKMNQKIFIKNNTSYTFSFISSLENYDKNIASYETLIKSIKTK